MAVDLDGKNVLVTGASSGIGHACAEAFAERGCRLLLAARRKDRLDELASTLRARHEVEVLTTSLDVRDSGAVESWVGGLTGEWRGIDILVNNAGLSRGIEPLHEGDISDWEEMIDTNLKGLLYVTRAVLPGMVDRGHGHQWFDRRRDRGDGRGEPRLPARCGAGRTIRQAQVWSGSPDRGNRKDVPDSTRGDRCIEFRGRRIVKGRSDPETRSGSHRTA